MRHKIAFTTTAASAVLFAAAAPAFADYYPDSHQNWRGGFEIEAKALYGSPKAPQFMTVDAYSYQPGKQSAKIRGLNAVCGLANGTSERVSVGPQGTGPDTVDQSPTDPWNPGAIWGTGGGVSRAGQRSTNALGALDVWAYDKVTHTTAHVTGFERTNNRTGTRLGTGGLTITLHGPLADANGNPTGKVKTISCTSRGINPLTLPMAPPPDFSVVFGDFDTHELS